MNKKLQNEVSIVGAGDSYWGGGGNSTGEFLVTHYDISWIDYEEGDGNQPYGLQLFGPKTIWQHYTDSGIVKEVNDKLLTFLQENVDPRIKRVAWSEQGMQPDSGWSFDILL